jgi:HEPN domain-containing protein
MPHDPVLVSETKDWLIKAAQDLRSAEHALIALPPLLGDVAYHCQQATEKALKAFLVWHNIPFRKTHSLEEIGEQCLDKDITLKASIDRAVPLTEYAWLFRYPGESVEPSEEEVREALAIACETYQAILSRLPKDVSP